MDGGNWSAAPWALVIIGGPLILGLAMLMGRLRSRKRDKQIDPVHPSDDPGQGM